MLAGAGKFTSATILADAECGVHEYAQPIRIAGEIMLPAFGGTAQRGLGFKRGSSERGDSSDFKEFSSIHDYIR